MRNGKIILIGLLGGLSAFIGGKLAWSIFPWHAGLFEQLQQPQAVVETVKSAMPRPGIYLLPAQPDFNNKTDEQIVELQKEFLKKKMTDVSAFLVVKPNGSLPFGRSVLFTLWANFMAGILIMILLSMLPPQTAYFQKLAFIVGVALTGGILTQVQYFAWWDLPDKFVLVSLLDLVFAWFFAGTIMLQISKFSLRPAIANAESPIQKPDA